MEAMLVYLTDDFHDSSWTDQEVGFASGKGVPILSVKVGTIDPRGFLSSQQALDGTLKSVPDLASAIFSALQSEVRLKSRMKQISIDAFVTSNCYNNTIASLRRLREAVDHLSDAELDLIIKGYAKNDQLHGCEGIRTHGNSLKRFLEAVTDKRFDFRNTEIVEIRKSNDGMF